MFVAAKRWGSPCLGDIFFRASDRGRQVGERPFPGLAVYNRLRVYLSEAKLCNGKRPIVSGSGLPTPLVFWVVLRKR